MDQCLFSRKQVSSTVASDSPYSQLRFSSWSCSFLFLLTYSVNLLSALLPIMAALLSVAVSALNVTVTVLSAPLADKFGRQTSFLQSIVGLLR